MLLKKKNYKNLYIKADKKLDVQEIKRLIILNNNYM